MLENNISALDIINILEELVSKNLVEYDDDHMVFRSKKFIVTFQTAHELNKIILQLDLVKYLEDGQTCVKILDKLGYKDVGSGMYDTLRNLGSKAFFWLNDRNGLSTAKLVLTVIWDGVSELK